VDYKDFDGIVVWLERVEILADKPSFLIHKEILGSYLVILLNALLIILFSWMYWSVCMFSVKEFLNFMVLPRSSCYDRSVKIKIEVSDAMRGCEGYCCSSRTS
jgi:hypothetical protein